MPCHGIADAVEEYPRKPLARPRQQGQQGRDEALTGASPPGCRGDFARMSSHFLSSHKEELVLEKMPPQPPTDRLHGYKAPSQAQRKGASAHAIRPWVFLTSGLSLLVFCPFPRNLHLPLIKG